MEKQINSIEASATVKRTRGTTLSETRRTAWVVECKRGGQLKWAAYVPHNLAVTEGLNHSITAHFKGAAYTATWYIGLTAASPSFVAADTMAAHGGWTESTAYTETYRQTLTLGTVAGGSAHNHASPGTYSINASATIGGIFLCTDSAVGSANGTLYGGGAFTNGNQTVGSGDSLTARVTLAAGAG